MKIVNRNAALAVFDRVKEITREEHHDSWRCIYVSLANKHERYNSSLRAHFFVNTISQVLREDEGSIYLCDDGDIFILFQGILQPVVAKLARHFGDLNPDQLATGDPSSLFSIFDLSIHAQKLFAICETKYHKVIASSQKLRRNLGSYRRALIGSAVHIPSSLSAMHSVSASKPQEA